MLSAAGVIVASYVVGSVPIAYLVGRATKGIDIREHGSGNVGASNVWQSVSRAVAVPVGLAQVAQGAAGVFIARAVGEPEGVQVAAGLAVVAAHDWNPWLRFSGGRGIGPAIGFMGALSLPALVAFIAVALAGIVLKAIPQSIALALIGAPLAALVAADRSSVVLGLALLSVAVLLKRLLANAAPDPAYPRPQVWLTRLVYDRDDPDRDAWVRRNLEPSMRR
ncbi:MAG: glycerol-3-phosphate acyltransferase [Chloroflexota bacterium]|nr:glycerol-3-phosphate acyltransferase [Chloroflexota bacterium]